MTSTDRNRRKRHLLWSPPVIGRTGRRMNKPTYLASNNMPARRRRGMKSFKKTQGLVKKQPKRQSRLRKVTFLR